MGNLTTLIVVASAITLSCVPAALAVSIETVTIGDPGNAPDHTNYGSVSIPYHIGKYEVTNNQYAKFLNAVAASDPKALYNIRMASRYGGITRSGSSPNYTYDVIPGRGNMPVNYVSWYDALRFANWMHNGQPTGMQDASTTEDGAYDMSLGSSAIRKPGALVFLPTEDEWYKAAYYKGGGTHTGYWNYPTSSDTRPIAGVPPGTMINSSANYNFAANGDLTEVGAYTYKPSVSAYGTYDQGGNVAEWNEDIRGSIRILRGGSFVDLGWSLHAANRNSTLLTREDYFVGFRIAEVSEKQNESPVAVCQDVTVSADDNCQGTVESEDVDDGSFDPDGDPIVLTMTPSGPYELGITSITLTVTDTQGASDSCTATVTVVDVTPPEVSVADILEVWPPNHKYHTFNLSDCVVNVQDACEGTIDVDAAGMIVSIYSDEPEDARGVGDGQTVDDIIILGPSSFKVRAERQGKGNGRVYGVTFDVTDADGNITTATCYVGVPHDKSGDPPADDGPAVGYTVP